MSHNISKNFFLPLISADVSMSFSVIILKQIFEHKFA